jgi:hypothetical protein
MPLTQAHLPRDYDPGSSPTADRIPYDRIMSLDLSDDEKLALVRLLTRSIDDDRYRRRCYTPSLCRSPAIAPAWLCWLGNGDATGEVRTRSGNDARQLKA